MAAITECELCNGEIQYWLECHNESYYRCPQCDIVRKEHFVDPQAEKYRYSTHNNDPRESRYRQYLMSFLDPAICAYAPKGASVLDYGCGPSNAVQVILEQERPDLKVCSYDPFFYPETPETWLAEHGIQSFDFVFSNEVFEHMYKPSEEIKRLDSLMAPASILLVGTQLHNGNEKDFCSWWYKNDETHVHFYSEKSISYISRRLEKEFHKPQWSRMYVFGNIDNFS